MHELKVLQLRNLSCRICDDDIRKVVYKGKPNERVDVSRKVKIPEHAKNLVQSSTSPVPGRGPSGSHR